MWWWLTPSSLRRRLDVRRRRHVAAIKLMRTESFNLARTLERTYACRLVTLWCVNLYHVRAGNSAVLRYWQLDSRLSVDVTDQSCAVMFTHAYRVCGIDCGTICAPSLMAAVGQYVHWAGKAGRRMPRLLCYWLMLVVNSLKCNSWTINLAHLGRHAQLTRCFSAVAELLARSSATAEKQRVSCACLPRLANWLCNALNNADVPY